MEIQASGIARWSDRYVQMYPPFKTIKLHVQTVFARVLNICFVLIPLQQFYSNPWLLKKEVVGWKWFEITFLKIICRK